MPIQFLAEVSRQPVRGSLGIVNFDVKGGARTVDTKVVEM
jgi:hypothetical protein